jgi:putative flippase GtrA
MKNSITHIVDFFYPPFKRFMPLLTFRYAACGGGNTLVGLLVYYVGYHFIFDHQVFEWWIFAFKPHVASLFLAGIVSFILGFLLNKYVVFVESSIRGGVQLFRYALAFLLNLFLNFLLLKFMVEVLTWDAFVSQLITTLFVISLSYIIQKYFTFKIK